MTGPWPDVPRRLYQWEAVPIWLPAVSVKLASDADEWVSWHWLAARGRDPAGRARIVRRGRGRWVAVLRHRSTMAWSEVPRARRCRALRTAVGMDWLYGCARRRSAARTDPVPRRRSGGAMRRTGPACRSPTVLLPSAGHLQPRIRGGVCPQLLRGMRPWPCRAGTRSAGWPASLGRLRQSAWLLFSRIAELVARPFQILI